MLSLNLATPTPKLSGLLVLRTQLPLHPPSSHLPPPTKLPWKEPCLWDQRCRPASRLCHCFALGAKASQATCLCLQFPSVKWGLYHGSHAHSSQNGLSVPCVLGPGGIPRNNQTEPLLTGGGRAHAAVQAGSGQACEGGPDFVLWICLQQGAALPAGGVRWTSRTSGLTLQGRVGFQRVKMGSGVLGGAERSLLCPPWCYSTFCFDLLTFWDFLSFSGNLGLIPLSQAVDAYSRKSAVTSPLPPPP